MNGSEVKNLFCLPNCCFLEQGTARSKVFCKICSVGGNLRVFSCYFTRGAS